MSNLWKQRSKKERDQKIEEVLKEILPEEGLLSPETIFRSVDFPAPFLPIKAILSFSFITKLTPLNNFVAPN